MTFRFLLVTALLGSLVCGARAQTDWTRNFRAGLLVGMNIDAEFKTTGQFAISGNNPGVPGAGTDHFYDDGYVRVDAGGATAPDYYTSFWGGTSYDPNASTLTFLSSRSVSIANENSRIDDAPYLGFDLAYGGTFGWW